MLGGGGLSRSPSVDRLPAATGVGSAPFGARAGLAVREARTTATPIAVVRGTARIRPIEPTIVRMSSAANCSVCSTWNSGRL